MKARNNDKSKILEDSEGKKEKSQKTYGLVKWMDSKPIIYEKHNNKTGWEKQFGFTLSASMQT